MTEQEHRKEFEERMMTRPDQRSCMIAQLLATFTPEEREIFTMDSMVGLLNYRVYGRDIDPNDYEDIVEKSYAAYCDLETWVDRYVSSAKSTLS